VKSLNLRRPATLVALLTAFAFASSLGATSAMASPGGTPQASITLNDSAATLAQWNNTYWSLTKDGSLSDSTANWTVNATKGATSDNMIGVFGYVSVTNTGSGPATIGNVVLNLQQKSGKTWNSVSADVADATNGDAATTAKICSGASSEGLSSFTENSGSGALNFVDASNNTIFSISPQLTLAPGATVNLGYSATFDNTKLNIAAGTSLRSEFIVSFGNAGARGGGGATCTNVDINGNGQIDSDEAYVRSVPSRVTNTLPAPTAVNATVTLSDTDPPDITTTGDVTYTQPASGIAPEQITDTTTNVPVTASDVNGGANGGTITNCAHLNGDGLSVTVGGFTFADFVPPVDLTACKQLTVGSATPPHFTTYTQGGWGADPHGNNAGQLLTSNFGTVYPGGSVVVGNSGGNYHMAFTSASAINTYLPAGGTAGALTANLTNPTSSSAGIFGGQVLALELNVDFSNANVTDPGFGNLTLCGLPASSLNGQTVSQILAAMNTALGGGALPAGYSFGGNNPATSLSQLATDLNSSWDGGNSGAFAANLCP
jgi:hypothetical protein